MVNETRCTESATAVRIETWQTRSAQQRQAERFQANGGVQRYAEKERRSAAATAERTGMGGKTNSAKTRWRSAAETLRKTQERSVSNIRISGSNLNARRTRAGSRDHLCAVPHGRR